MSSFTKPLTVTQLDADLWKIENSFEYYLDKDASCKVIIPKGFETDFASVPRLFWIFFPPSSGKYVQAAVIHDYLYEGGYVFKYGEAMTVSYKEADEIFLEAMTVLGTPTWQKYPIFYAVRFYSSCIKPIKGMI